MKDETKGIGLAIGTSLGIIIGVSIMLARVNSNISALDKKVESIFYFNKEVRLTLFEDTCHKQGGVYSETKEGGRCDNIEAYKKQSKYKCSDLLNDKVVGFAGTYGTEEESINFFKEIDEQRSECLKWKEAQDVLRKKNYKEYACKTLDTFEDYLACNEK